MKILFWAGAIVIVLGLLSLVIAIPHTEHSGVTAGGMSVGMQTHYDERVAPLVSGVLVLAGAGMMIAGRSGVRA
jgi:hypothetical protein